MIHHLVLFKLKAGVDGEKIEWMMRQTRIQLLKIPEVLTVRCGRTVDPEGEWPFFLSVEVESMDKLGMYAEDAVHIKFVEEVIKPHVEQSLSLDFETEPGKESGFHY
jgi:hypothetical protein